MRKWGAQLISFEHQAGPAKVGFVVAGQPMTLVIARIDANLLYSLKLQGLPVLPSPFRCNRPQVVGWES